METKNNNENILLKVINKIKEILHINKTEIENSSEGIKVDIPKDTLLSSPDTIKIDVPEELPILPIRGMVVFPQTAVPLTIGQPRSIKLVDEAVSDNRLIGVITSKNSDKENPDPEDLYDYGTVSIIHRFFKAPDGTIRLLLQGLYRFKITEVVSEKPFLKAKIKQVPEIQEEGLEIEALTRNVHDQFIKLAELVPSIPRELVASINLLEDPSQTAYTIANLQKMELQEAQEILDLDSISDKLRKLVSIMAREGEVLELGQKIQNEAKSEIDKLQREYFLREQLKAIQRELGETDEQTATIEEFKKQITSAHMSEEAEKQANLELERLSRLPISSAEYGVIRSYLDWLVSLPWSKSTEDNLDIKHAREVLNYDHYGLDDVKDRIIEFLTVRKMKKEREDILNSVERLDKIREKREGIILCFVGPPGVGKTSLGKSIARALGRKFIRQSLGGIRDEAEIRGHRRTYIGSMPGRILQSLRRIESNNPVFMLDEIDKISSDYRGDPSSALLEVLDPEQNAEFRDNYLEVSFNLSQIMFITTANQLESIPIPLLDRMEIIRIAGYTESEKIQIAKRYLIPRQLTENGLMPDELEFDDNSLELIIRSYTREAGVRNLERQIGSICRKYITNISEGINKPNKVNTELITEYLGNPKFRDSEEISRRTSTPGVATGLAWTPVGGVVLFVEATKMPGNKGFQITGSIGKVMEESANAALSYIRSHTEQLNIKNDFFSNLDIHLHIPTGAQPKDGPSAGVTITTALVSLIKNIPVKPDLGMTGEISLSGKVLPVGGIKEKILGAHRAKLKTILLPEQNKIDLDDIPE